MHNWYRKSRFLQRKWLFILSIIRYNKKISIKSVFIQCIFVIMGCI